MRAIREFSIKHITTRRFAAPILSVLLVLTVASACGELTGPKSPSTPTGVTATLLTGTSVLVSWTPSPLNDGVVGYSIFRNGTKVGESTTTSFTDTGLPQQQVFKYTVAANCTAGIVSDQSAESPAATVTTLDVTPPHVTSTSPANLQTAVSASATAAATFSEPMDSTTINTTTVVVRVTNGAVIPGTVKYTASTRVAEFTPAGPFPNPANITATITTGAKDLAGNKLAADFSWTFTTRDDTPPRVISTSPADGATSVAPASAINVTFSEAMDPTTITASTITLKATSTSLAVNGSVSYNATTHIATFIPNAPLAQSTGYTLTVAASVKDVGGNQMGAPFSMSFSTGDTVAPTVVSVTPANFATGVSPSTTVQVVFSEPMTASTITASTVFLTNTSTTAIVPATVAYNAATNTATLTPSSSLAGSTTFTVTVTTGAKDASGNGLSTAFTSVFTTAVVDSTPPTVSIVSPANGATNVPTGTTIQVTFSEAMDSSTITNANVTLKLTSTSTPVPASVVYDKTTKVATLTPLSALANGTGYTVTVTTGVKDVAGNALASTFTSTFTTAPPADVTAPTIVSRSPQDNATGVAVTAVDSLVFSEPMDSSTINNTTILLKDSTGATVAGTVAYIIATRTATFTPAAPLKNSARYTLAATSGAKDLAGNALAVASTAPTAFTTVADTTAPTIISTFPANNATGIAIDTAVTVTFSEAMDSSTVVNPANFKLTVTTGGAVVPSTITYNTTSHVAKLKPTAPLTPSTNYTFTLTSGVKDLAGNGLLSTNTFTFTTAPPAP